MIEATASGILSALRNPAIPMTDEDITESWRLLRARRDNNDRLAARSFNFSEKVEFTNPRNGMTVIGQVTKINQKTVSVLSMAGVTWRVPPAMLRTSA